MELILAQMKLRTDLKGGRWRKPFESMFFIVPLGCTKLCLRLRRKREGLSGLEGGAGALDSGGD